MKVFRITPPASNTGPSLIASLDDSDISGSTVIDVTGNGNDGAIIGTLASAVGEYSESRVFPNNESNYVDFGDVLDPGTNDYTISAFFRLYAVDTRRQEIVSKGGFSTGEPGWTIDVNQNEVRLLGSTSSDAFDVKALKTINPNTWYHVAAVINRVTNTARIFVNGTEYSTTAAGTSISGSVSSTQSLLIGRGAVSGFRPTNTSRSSSPRAGNRHRRDRRLPFNGGC